MLFRNCAGGVVFYQDKVFLLKNDKNEWVLPKGKIRNGSIAVETALERVKSEAGIDADIISSAGGTSYEFFSVSRKKPVCNEIVWYVMEAKSDDYNINEFDGFLDGGFYSINDAINLVTYNQEKALVSLSYKKYLNYKEEKVESLVTS